MSQIQAKESIDIPKEIYDTILTELHKNKIYDFKTLTLKKIKKILKKLSLYKYYEHSSHIKSKISGIPAPSFGRNTEEMFRMMFKDIQLPFEKHRPPKRINYLSYSYD